MYRIGELLANFVERLISIRAKNVVRPGLASSGWLLAVGSICPNTKEEEKEQQGRGPKGQVAPIPPNPPARINCTNGQNG